MGFWAWLANNWFNLASLLLGTGVWFAGLSLHAETKARRVANHFAAIQNHRELWTDFYRRPELWRILDGSADVLKAPPTLQESGFVKLVIQHTNGVYQALQNGLVIKPEGLRRDVCSFFSLPIPRAVWHKVGVLQNDDFVTFIDRCLERK